MKYKPQGYIFRYLFHCPSTGLPAVKKYFCPYCSVGVSRLPDHLESVHKKENEVVYLNSLRGKERQAQLTKLRNIGAAKHNTSLTEHQRTLGDNTGFQVKYRPKTCNNTFLNYIQCAGCTAYYSKKTLWKHQKTCNLCSSSKKGMARGRELRVHAIETTTPTRRLLSKLKTDSISELILHDDLLVRYAQCLASKGPGLAAYSRNSLRELGRLVEKTREMSKDDSIHLVTLIDPVFYPKLVQIVKDLCQDGPSLGLRLGHSLNKVAQIVETDSYIQGGETSRDSARKAKEFLKVMTHNWNRDIASRVRKSLYDKQLNNTPTPPSADDIKILNEFLKRHIVDSIKDLTKDPKKEDYVHLQKVVLCLIVVFNRKRAGEASRITTENYQKGFRANTIQNSAEYGLTAFEKELIKTHQRIEIHGKWGRHVPIILTKLMGEGLQTLLKFRSDFIDESNPYIFALQSSVDSHIRATDVLRVFSLECGAKYPSTLRSTKLRKHIATQSQVLNLAENEIDILAGFMGHSKEIHKRHYRLPSGVLQVAKVTKILLAMENGSIKSLGGRTLDDIDLAGLENAAGNINK